MSEESYTSGFSEFLLERSFVTGIGQIAAFVEEEEILCDIRTLFLSTDELARRAKMTGSWLSVARSNPSDTYVVCKAKDRPTDQKQLKLIQRDCTESLLTKFKFMSASCDKDTELLDSYNLNTQIDSLVARLKKNDLLDAFDVFETPIVLDSSGVPELPSDITVLDNVYNILTDTVVNGKNRVVTLKEAQEMCLFKRTYGETWQVQNVAWSSELVENSSEKDLFLKVTELMKDIPPAEQGGIVYFVLMKGIIQSNTEQTVRILKTKLLEMKISDYDGENVRVVVSLIKGVLSRLESVFAIPSNEDTTSPVYEDMVMNLTNIMSTSSNTEFNSMFEAMKQFRRLEMPGSDKKRDEILTIAEKAFLDISASPKGWLSTKKTRAAFLATKDCFNCGKPGHIKSNCPDIKKTGNAIKDKQKNTPWFRTPPSQGERWTKTLKNGGETHWCAKCGRWQQSHKGSQHKTKAEIEGAKKTNALPGSQANIAETPAKDDFVQIDAKSLDNLSQEEIKSLGKGKVLGLMARLQSINFE